LSFAELEKALSKLQVHEEKGIVTAFDERFLIMPVKFMHSIEDLLVRTFGPLAAANLLYEMGKEAGKHSIWPLPASAYGIKSARDFHQTSQKLVALCGWGTFSNVQFDHGKLMARSQGTNSIFVRKRTGRTPVCHYIRGLEAGAFETASGRPCESIEVMCEGKGNANCEIFTGKPFEIARLAENLEDRT